MKEKLGCIAALAYLGIGFVQLLATIKGIQISFDWPWILASFVSLIIAYIPIVGTVAGIKGATAGWGWALVASHRLLLLALRPVFCRHCHRRSCWS